MSFQVPVPNWINRVNFVTAFFMQGCDAPFQLFVQFAGPPAGRAVALIAEFSWDDIVKEFWRPAGLRSARHGRKGVRGKKGAPELPDPNNEVAKRIPGQREFAGRPFGSPTFYVFEISDVADRLSYNFAVIDVITETMYEGLLGILSTDRENCPLIGRTRRSWKDRMPIGQGGGGWMNFDIDHVEYAHRIDSSDFGAWWYGEAQALVSLQIYLRRNWPGPTTVQVGLRFDINEEPEAIATVTLNDEGDDAHLTCDFSTTKSNGVQWVIKNSNGWVDIEDVSITIVTIPK
jgi:hypothetical protein